MIFFLLNILILSQTDRRHQFIDEISSSAEFRNILGNSAKFSDNKELLAAVLNVIADNGYTKYNDGFECVNCDDYILANYILIGVCAILAISLFSIIGAYVYNINYKENKKNLKGDLLNSNSYTL